MRPVPERDIWDAGLRAGHMMVVTLDLFTGPDTSPVPLLGFTGGSVSLDATAAVRGSCSLTFVDDGTMGLVPTDADSKLAPFGNEILIKRGILLPDGWQYLVPIGVYGIHTTTPDETDSGFIINVTGFDRAQQISDADFLAARTIATGSGYFEVMRNMILEVDVDATFNFPDDDARMTVAEMPIGEGDDRWETLQDMASAIGVNLYLDGDGAYTIKPIPTLDDDPIAEMVEGDGGLLTSAAPEWTREGAFNAVVYTGNNPNDTGDVPRGQAIDNDPNSPTYFYGKFGQAPTFENSEWISDNDQAQVAASGKLNKEKGVHKSVTFGGIVDPSLEPDDVIYIKREKIGIDENHILSSFTIPLDAPSAAAGSTRAQVRT